MLLNSAFVFVKPHANTAATQDMVKSKLTEAGIEILSEQEISGKTIDEGKLIDQHYYAIASKATILSADKIPVPTDKFESEFGETWETVLAEGRAVNAMEACERFGCDADELDTAWGKAEKVVKFGGGFYCGIVSYADKPKLYVFNAFFMSMRSKFVGEGTSIHCYEVQWEPSKLSWEAFRNDLLGYVLVVDERMAENVDEHVNEYSYSLHRLLAASTCRGRSRGRCYLVTCCIVGLGNSLTHPSFLPSFLPLPFLMTKTRQTHQPRRGTRGIYPTNDS